MALLKRMTGTEASFIPALFMRNMHLRIKGKYNKVLIKYKDRILFKYLFFSLLFILLKKYPEEIKNNGTQNLKNHSLYKILTNSFENSGKEWEPTIKIEQTHFKTSNELVERILFSTRIESPFLSNISTYH
ncbi:MAG: hypothetical protein MR863_00135 [Solobacterium sp.]|nr:hypothetical protein [Solobacterium sp.]